MSFRLPKNKPLVVPEFDTAQVKLYVAHPETNKTVEVSSYTIDGPNSQLRKLIEGTFRFNACALHGNDLFIANSSSDPNSSCIFKVPNYLVQGSTAVAQASVFTRDSDSYVGMTFDRQGNLYAAAGKDDPKDNHISRYTGTDKPVNMGHAGMTSFFANLAFDAAGNLWVSDYLNHRLVVFEEPHLGEEDTSHFHQLISDPHAVFSAANTNPDFQKDKTHLFAEPEGIDFDAEGNLWVANNNDGGGIQLFDDGGQQLMDNRDPRTSLVKIGSCPHLVEQYIDGLFRLTL